MQVRQDELPRGESIEFRDSSFFKTGNVDLPTPQEVRAEGQKSDPTSAYWHTPPPVKFEELGLLVKYGPEITIAEAHCLWFFNQYMKEKVPTPELFGWRCDGKDTFIYMELVRGQTLQERWGSLNDEERKIICGELKGCVEAWRELRQETEPSFIGHIGGQGVGDIIFRDAGNPNPGPFKDLASFHDYFAALACRRSPEVNPRIDWPEFAGLTDNRTVVFTHADLHRSNIMVTDGSSETPVRIIAIIDWHQSGWYPIDWEWLKAQWSCVPIGPNLRDTGWLNDVLAPADDDYFYAWEFVTTSL